MCKHNPICAVTTGLTVIGGINWGLVGLGDLLGKNLNLVNLLVGKWPMVETIVYLLVGISALGVGYVAVTKGDQCCGTC